MKSTLLAREPRRRRRAPVRKVSAEVVAQYRAARAAGCHCGDFAGRYPSRPCSVFTCPGCERPRPSCQGAAGERSDLCDGCWATWRKDPVSFDWRVWQRDAEAAGQLWLPRVPR